MPYKLPSVNEQPPSVLHAASVQKTPGESVSPRLLDSIRITDIQTFATAPAGVRLLVVKVITNTPGLYGLGCATFTQRLNVVKEAIDGYLKPFLIGKNPLQIEDIWQSCYLSSYWRNGPVLGYALGGVDMALWDILGKWSGLPVYQLLGGKARNSVETYLHASGSSLTEVEDRVRELIEKGQRHVRVQMAVPGQWTYGASKKDEGRSSEDARQRRWPWDHESYVKAVPELFAHLREKVGWDVELLHDVHERIPPQMAITLARALEPYRPFFLEDVFSLEDIGWLDRLRSLSAVPIAMGELFTSPHEWLPLVSKRAIDYIRVHIPTIGGLTPARKLAAVCEYYGVRTAWHGPSDLAPIAHACNFHLDLAVSNFGIQEARIFTQGEQDVFPGCPEFKDGNYWVSDRPGFGVDFDEQLAAKFPITTDPPFDFRWGSIRSRDGAVVRP